MDDIVEDALSKPETEEQDCYVCGEEIPLEEGVQPVEGEEYAVIRENSENKPYPLTEKWIHRDCLPQYLEQSHEQ